jgi:hypothetical protein
VTRQGIDAQAASSESACAGGTSCRFPNWRKTLLSWTGARAALAAQEGVPAGGGGGGAEGGGAASAAAAAAAPGAAPR